MSWKTKKSTFRFRWKYQTFKHDSKWFLESFCTIARYGYAKWTYNVYIYIYIYIEHRNLEIRKTRNDFSVQVRNFLLPLSLKVLRHKERDTHSFYPGFFICPLLISCDTCPRPPRANESQPFSPEAGLNSTNWLFQKNPKIFHALLVRDVIRTC